MATALVLVVALQAAGAATIVTRFILRTMQRQTLPYPPGPPGKPIIGNAFDIPKTAMSQSHQYADWKRTYGGSACVVLPLPMRAHEYDRSSHSPPRDGHPPRHHQRPGHRHRIAR